MDEWAVCRSTNGIILIWLSYIADEVTRDYLNSRICDGLTRKLLLLPWQPDDMRHLSFDQKEDEQMFNSVSANQT